MEQLENNKELELALKKSIEKRGLKGTIDRLKIQEKPKVPNMIDQILMIWDPKYGYKYQSSIHLQQTH